MNKKSFDIHKAAGIVIVERKLLVTREKGKDIFISPGGIVEEGEDPKDTVVRELMEEVSLMVDIKDLEKFGIFYADAANNPGSWLKMEVFNVKSWFGEPTPSSGEEQIEEMLWLTSEIPDGIKVGSIYEHEVIPRLKKLGLID
jgi:ADP-ribose pyrophosphatase YjhB (NUDIX family)